MLYMAQPTFPLFAPRFPIFASRWDELAQPAQTTAPSSIPSGRQAAVYDIIRPLPLENPCRSRPANERRSNRQAIGLAAGGAQQVGVERDVTGAGWRARDVIRRARAGISRENSTGRGGSARRATTG